VSPVYLKIEVLPEKHGQSWQTIQGEVRQAFSELVAFLEFAGYDTTKGIENGKAKSKGKKSDSAI